MLTIINAKNRFLAIIYGTRRACMVVTAFCRYLGLLAGLELPRPLGGCCVLVYSTLFDCNLEEAEPSSVWSYPSIGAFFTRSAMIAFVF